MRISKELVAASATPLVLSILSQGESYGYAIIKQVHELSEGEVTWTDGMLYPVLHRLERQGLIESRWDTSEIGRKRRYYRLKEEGSRVLAREQQHWMTVHSMLSQLWEKGSCSISTKPLPDGATT